MDTATSPKASRRSFIKAGAFAAVPLAAAAPVAALASDDARTQLARVQDERAIEALHRAVLRRISGEGDCGSFVASADAVSLEDGVRKIADDPHKDGTLQLAADGRTAESRRPVLVELDTRFAGHSTLEKMARFQGHGSHARQEERVMLTDYVKAKDGWRIARLRLV